MSSPFMDSIRRVLLTHHYSYRTEQAYLHWIKRFIFHHNKRHPREMGATKVGVTNARYTEKGLATGLAGAMAGPRLRRPL